MAPYNGCSVAGQANCSSQVQIRRMALYRHTVCQEPGVMPRKSLSYRGWIKSIKGRRSGTVLAAVGMVEPSVASGPSAENALQASAGQFSLSPTPAQQATPGNLTSDPYESLGSIGEAIKKAIADSPGAQGSPEATEAAASSTSASLDVIVSDSLSGLGSSASGSVSAAKDTLLGIGNSLSDSAAAVAGAVDVAGAKEALSSVSESLSSAGASLTGSAADVSQQVAGAVSGAVDSAASAVSGLSNTVNEATGGVLDTVSAASGAAISQATSLTDAVYSALPGPLQAGLSALLPAASAAGAALVADPKAGLAAAGVAVGVPAFAVWNTRYGGYSGSLAPGRVLEILSRENALVVDIRSEDARLKDGVFELKRGARGKAAVVPLLPAEAYATGGRLASRVKNSSSLAVAITAAIVSGLSKVDSETCLIVVDGGDGKAIELARALKASGRSRAYVLEGGFPAWAEAGLSVKPGVDYAVSPLEALADEAEVLAEETTSLLSRPPVAAAAAVGSAAVLWGLVDYKSELKFVGALGLLVTLVNKLRQYNSPQELFDDIAFNFGKAQRLASKVAGSVSSAAQSAQSSRASTAVVPLAPESESQEVVRPVEGSGPLQGSTSADVAAN